MHNQHSLPPDSQLQFPSKTLAVTLPAHSLFALQTLMCLELWVKVLAAAAPQGTLQPLVYPTTQLLLGAARLVPTPRYFPIRLRLVRAINKLAQVGL